MNIIVEIVVGWLFMMNLFDQSRLNELLHNCWLVGFDQSWLDCLDDSWSLVMVVLGLLVVVVVLIMLGRSSSN